MAIDFPSTSGQPTDGSFTHTHNGLTWEWNGTSWIKQEDLSSIDLSDYVKKVDTSSLSIERTGATSFIGIDTEGYFSVNTDTFLNIDVGAQINVDGASTFQLDTVGLIKINSDSYLEINSTHVTFKDENGAASLAKFDSNGLNLYSGGIRDKDGSLGTPGYVLSTTGSQIEWVPNSGGSGSGNSMEHDLWVLTTAPDSDNTVTYSDAKIGDGSLRNGDFGRPATSFYTKNGTGMLESNGEFAFPTEGQWEIKSSVVVFNTATSGAGDSQSHQVWIEYASNLTNWVTVSSSKTTEHLTSSGSHDVQTIHNHYIANVTNSTNARVRFKVSSNSPSTIETALDKTQFWFKKLESGTTTTTGGGGANSFTDLSDTPNTHDNDKWLKSNGTDLIWTTAPGITIQNAGVNLSTDATIINFTGTGVTASGTGSIKTINISDNNTTYNEFSPPTVSSGLVPTSSWTSGSTTQFLRSDGSWATPTGTTYSTFSTTATGLVPITPGGITKYLRADGSWQVPPNTTYLVYNGGTSGLVPSQGSAGDDKFLRSDGTWADVSTSSADGNDYVTGATLGTGVDAKKLTLSFADATLNKTVDLSSIDSDTTYLAYNGGNAGLVPSQGSAGGNKFLRSDGTWADVTSSGGTGDGNTTYVLEALISPGVKLTGSDNTTNSIFFDSGDGISLTRTQAPGASGGGTIKFQADTFTGTTVGFVPASSSSETTKFLKSDGSWDIPTNTTYLVYNGGTSGLVPSQGSAGGNKFLRSDGTWADVTSSGEANQNAFSKIEVNSQSDVEADGPTDKVTFIASGGMTITTNGSTDSITFDSDDTTYNVVSAGNDGLAPALPASPTGKFLRDDATWQTISTTAADGNTTYSLEALISPGVKLTGSDNSNDSVFFDAGTGITLTRTSAPGSTGGGTIQFAADTFTGTDVGLVPNGDSAGDEKFLRSDGTWQTVATTSGEVNQNAFSKIVVGGTTVQADDPSDTVTFIASTNVTITPNASSDSITFQSQDTTYSAYNGGNAGLVPANGSAGQDKYLRSDGNWADVTASSATSATTATNANNVKIRTDNGGAWHYLTYVDSSTDNLNQELKLDGGLQYYPSANWLRTDSINCSRFYDWSNNSYGSSGQIIVSKGSSSWQWSSTVVASGSSTNVQCNFSGTYGGIEIKTDGELLLKRTTGSTGKEGGHLQFEDATGNRTSFAIDIYRNTTSDDSVLRFIDQNTGTERFSVGPEGQWGIGHIARDYGQMGEVMISRGPNLSPVWGNHSGIAGSGIFASSAQGATADTANAEIDHIYSQLNAIGNDDSITTVAQLKTALLALVRN